MLETHPFEPFVPKNAWCLLLGSFVGRMHQTDHGYARFPFAFY